MYTVYKELRQAMSNLVDKGRLLQSMISTIPSIAATFNDYFVDTLNGFTQDHPWLKMTGPIGPFINVDNQDEFSEFSSLFPPILFTFTSADVPVNARVLGNPKTFIEQATELIVSGLLKDPTTIFVFSDKGIQVGKEGREFGHPVLTHFVLFLAGEKMEAFLMTYQLYVDKFGKLYTRPDLNMNGADQARAFLDSPIRKIIQGVHDNESFKGLSNQGRPVLH